MKARFGVAAVIGGLLLSSQAFGFAGGSAHHYSQAYQQSGDQTPTTSVPEPASIYAITSGLVLVGAARWFLRRR